MWAHPCAHVIFDTDPTPRGRSGPAEEAEMSQAMIRCEVVNKIGMWREVTLGGWVLSVVFSCQVTPFDLHTS